MSVELPRKTIICEAFVNRRCRYRVYRYEVYVVLSFPISPVTPGQYILPFPLGNSNCIFIEDPCDPDRRVDDSAVVDKVSLFLARVVGFGMGESDSSSE